MQPVSDVGNLRRVLGGALDRHLLEGQTIRALAGDGVVGQRRDVEMAERKAREVVRLVRFEHVRLQHRVVRAAAKRDPVIRERVLDELEVVAELLPTRVLEPGREARQHFVPIELSGRAGVAMPERNVGGTRRPFPFPRAFRFGTLRR